MSIPTDSVGPTPPSGTSDPVTLKGWFKRISDWIVGLSPAGATVYDTRWIDVTPASGFTFNAQPQVRRIGQVVYWRGDILSTAGWTTAYTPALPAANIPSWAIPPRSSRDAQAQLSAGSVSAFAIGTVDAAGVRLAASNGVVPISLKGLSGYTVN